MSVWCHKTGRRHVASNCSWPDNPHCWYRNSPNPNPIIVPPRCCPAGEGMPACRPAAKDKEIGDSNSSRDPLGFQWLRKSTLNVVFFDPKNSHQINSNRTNAFNEMANYEEIWKWSVSGQKRINERTYSWTSAAWLYWWTKPLDASECTGGRQSRLRISKGNRHRNNFQARPNWGPCQIGGNAVYYFFVPLLLSCIKCIIFLLSIYGEGMKRKPNGKGKSKGNGKGSEVRRQVLEIKLIP